MRTNMVIIETYKDGKGKEVYICDPEYRIFDNGTIYFISYHIENGSPLEHVFTGDYCIRKFNEKEEFDKALLRIIKKHNNKILLDKISLEVNMEGIIENTYKQCRKYFNSDLSWEDKYDLILKTYNKSGVEFDWFCYDTTYQEDIELFMRYFREYIEKLQKAGFCTGVNLSY